MRNFFSIAALLALLTPVQDRTGASPKEQAVAFLGAGKADLARASARACAEAGDAGCLLIEGRAAFGSGDFAGAATALAAARPALSDLDAHVAKLLGEALLLDGRAAEAVVALRDAESKDPSGPAGLRAAALLADALLAAEDPRAAIAQAGRASDREGQPGEIRAGLALVEAEALSALADRAERSAAGPPAQKAAQAWRAFWLEHPDHPAADRLARAEEARLAAIAGKPLPDPSGRDLLTRSQRLLSAGQPGAAVAQAQAAVKALKPPEAAEAQLTLARSLAADGRRTEAGPALAAAYKSPVPRIAAASGLLYARDRARRGLDADAIKILDDVARRFPKEPEADEAAYVAAHLLLDGGQEGPARTRLARLAARRQGAHASDARWTLAWLSFRRGMRDAPERFAEFAASADSDELRAQGLYWQSRASKGDPDPLLRRVIELDPLGWYGLLARQRLRMAGSDAAPFPRPAEERALPATGGGRRPEHPDDSETVAELPKRLRVAEQLFGLGLYAEAGAEADRFVREKHGHSAEVALALSVYQKAQRYDRAASLAESLLGWHPRPNSPRDLLAAAYPIAYPAQVGSSAARAGLDPYFLLAIMRRESLFRPDIRSAAGAVGLLQLLPATARRASIVLGRAVPAESDMANPAVAIDLGAWYLSELVGRFGDPAIAAAAYNAGPRIAAPWVVKGKDQPLDEWVESIPYRETRKYVKAVSSAWSAYRILAGGKAPSLIERIPAPRPGAAF
ncbi:MAG: transglycosylase SLT domain-containing protein [Myxococcales bacterium]